jgi:signal transduction histidine kinase
MASVSVSPSPLQRSLLALLGDGGTAADLETRFREQGFGAEPGVIGRLIDDASALGLVRVAGRHQDAPRYVVTSLGQRIRDGSDLSANDADRLRDLETLRTDLSATIAHELRTPLTAIRTCAGLLLSDDARPTPEQHRTLVETIERNAERMQRVVGDILDLARFRAGSVVLQLRRFDAVTSAEATLASIEPVARARGIRLSLETSDASIDVYGDRPRLGQALLNLVSNAVRFAPDDGHVTVTVGRDGPWLRLAVRDDGPGIAEDDQARLFERFFVGRADRGGPRDGVGLGLPTALAITQAHGGRIEVDSRPGAGSTFTIVVPIDGPDDQDAAS